MPGFFGQRDYISPIDIHKQEKMTFFKKFVQQLFYVLIFAGFILPFFENSFLPVLNGHNNSLMLIEDEICIKV